MSKEFKSQDYFRYKRLGKRWRRPVGWQSKLRLKKGGAGRLVSIGYGTRKEGELDDIVLVRNVSDVRLANGKPIRIASGVGAKKTLEISAEAGKLGSRIVNAKKSKRATRIKKNIEAKKIAKKEKKEAEKKDEEKKEAKAEKKDAEKEAGKIKTESKAETDAEKKENTSK